jgi:hypothetical protein
MAGYGVKFTFLFYTGRALVSESQNPNQSQSNPAKPEIEGNRRGTELLKA